MQLTRPPKWSPHVGDVKNSVALTSLAPAIFLNSKPFLPKLVSLMRLMTNFFFYSMIWARIRCFLVQKNDDKSSNHHSKVKEIKNFIFHLLLLISKAPKCCRNDLYSAISTPSIFFPLPSVLPSLPFSQFHPSCPISHFFGKANVRAINYCRASKTDHRQCRIVRVVSVIIIFLWMETNGGSEMGRHEILAACLTMLEVVWECVHTCDLLSWISRTCSINRKKSLSLVCLPSLCIQQNAFFHRRLKCWTESTFL